MTDKQIRNLRVTLAVIIAKLKLNTAQPGEDKPYFTNQEGLLHYIQALVSHAMLGADRLEIPEFYYDRNKLNDYDQLKHLLASALTKLQKGSGSDDPNLAGVYQALLGGLRHL
jgi:hypothetical protein